MRSGSLAPGVGSSWEELKKRGSTRRVPCRARGLAVTSLPRMRSATGSLLRRHAGRERRHRVAVATDRLHAVVVGLMRSGVAIVGPGKRRRVLAPYPVGEPTSRVEAASKSRLGAGSKLPLTLGTQVRLPAQRSRRPNGSGRRHAVRDRARALPRGSGGVCCRAGFPITAAVSGSQALNRRSSRPMPDAPAFSARRRRSTRVVRRRPARLSPDLRSAGAVGRSRRRTDEAVRSWRGRRTGAPVRPLTVSPLPAENVRESDVRRRP